MRLEHISQTTITFYLFILFIFVVFQSSSSACELRYIFKRLYVNLIYLLISLQTVCGFLFVHESVSVSVSLFVCRCLSASVSVSHSHFLSLLVLACLLRQLPLINATDFIHRASLFYRFVHQCVSASLHLYLFVLPVFV